jgi:hypothetical protein
MAHKLSQNAAHGSLYDTPDSDLSGCWSMIGLAVVLAAIIVTLAIAAMLLLIRTTPLPPYP